MISATAVGVPTFDFDLMSNDDQAYRDNLPLLDECCRWLGCFRVVNHGLDLGVAAELTDNLVRFFRLPPSDKLRSAVDDGDGETGYVPFATQNVNAFMGRSGLPNDPVEKLAFRFRPLTSDIPEENVWPSEPDDLRSKVVDYVRSMNGVSERIMRLVSRALHQRLDFVHSRCADGDVSFKCNFYPGRPTEDGRERFAPHTDISLFTVLQCDGPESALHVQHRVTGRWLPVDNAPGSLFVNLGDVVRYWTDSAWTSCVHKVAPATGQDRLSLVYFVSPSPNVSLDCLSFWRRPETITDAKPFSYEQLLKMKMLELRLGSLNS